MKCILLQEGKTVNGVEYQNAYDNNGLITGENGDAVREAYIPVGGAADVKGKPTGSGNKVPSTEDAIFTHEVFGHGMNEDFDAATTVENEYRRNRKPPLGERSGEDHTREVTVTFEEDYSPIIIEEQNIQTEITLRPLEKIPF